jgi:ATP-dependent Zn protease
MCRIGASTEVNEMGEELKATAIHEAGHAVAHCRLEILQGLVSIEPNAETQTLGRSTAEGAEHVWSREEAESQVLALYAGYGALLAAGYPHEIAEHGAWGGL